MAAQPKTKKERPEARRRTHKQRLQEVYAFGQAAYWAIREALEAETGTSWEYISWKAVEEFTGCGRVTLQRLWGKETRFVRADTLQKLADVAGLGDMYANIEKRHGLQIYAG